MDKDTPLNNIPSMPQIQPLEPECAICTISSSAETRVLDGGVLCDGRGCRLVIGTWRKEAVDLPGRTDKDFDKSIAFGFTDPDTVAAARALLRRIDDDLERAEITMRETIAELIAAQAEDKQGRIDYLRMRAVLARKQEEALAAYQAPAQGGER